MNILSEDAYAIYDIYYVLFPWSGLHVIEKYTIFGWNAVWLGKDAQC